MEQGYAHHTHTHHAQPQDGLFPPSRELAPAQLDCWAGRAHAKTGRGTLDDPYTTLHVLASAWVARYP